MIEINIKLNNPPADVAVATLETEIESLALSSENLLKVIHGYGSNNRGGEIKRQMLLKLKKLKIQGKIKDYFPCEKFRSASTYNIALTKIYPELILDPDLLTRNPGITIIVLNT